ncbi:MAG: RNA polymerase sigma factor [Candidatus Baltobacteraceae bacterium]
MRERNEQQRQRRLAAELARDCDATFERFVLAYQDRIYAFCVSLTKDRGTAQEIAQDVFVRAYAALKTYDTQRICELSLRGWLYQIALNLTKNSRRRKRFDLTAIDDAHDAVSDAKVAHEVEQAELARTIRAAVGRLPVPMRAAVVLRHLNDLPYDEIARITGQPEGTIKSNVHRGMALLRKELVHVNI